MDLKDRKDTLDKFQISSHKKTKEGESKSANNQHAKIQSPQVNF